MVESKADTSRFVLSSPVLVGVAALAPPMRPRLPRTRTSCARGDATWPRASQPSHSTLQSNSGSGASRVEASTLPPPPAPASPIKRSYFPTTFTATARALHCTGRLLRGKFILLLLLLRLGVFAEEAKLLPSSSSCPWRPRRRRRRTCCTAVASAVCLVSRRRCRAVGAGAHPAASSPSPRSPSPPPPPRRLAPGRGRGPLMTSPPP